MAETDVTLILRALSRDGPVAFEKLLAIVHDELRIMARDQMARERFDHTLQPTALVNELYVRLVRQEPTFENRAHFFGAAAEAMRRILVDHARKRAAQKRGGDRDRVTFHDLQVESCDPRIDLLALDDALTALADYDTRLAQIVRLRYFAGFSIEQVAESLSVSPATIKRDWSYARAWILERMSEY